MMVEDEGVISTDDDDDEEDYPDSPSAGDDDVEDATFGAPQWSWCGYKIDDDKFKSELGKLIASARAQGELTMEGGQSLLRQIGDCAALDAHPVLNHHNVVDEHLLLNACELTGARLRYVAKVAASTAPGRLPEALVMLAALRAFKQTAHPYESYMALRALDCLLQHPRQPGLSSEQRLMAQLCVELGAVTLVREQWDVESTLLRYENEDKALIRMCRRSEDLCIHILGALLACTPCAETLKGLHWVGYGCSLVAGPLPDRCLSLIAAGVRRAHIDFLDTGDPAKGFYPEGRIPQAVKDFVFYATAADENSPHGCVVRNLNVAQRLNGVCGYLWIIAYLAEDKLLAAKVIAGLTSTSFVFGGGLFANTAQALLSWASGEPARAHIMSTLLRDGEAATSSLELLRGACEAALAQPSLTEHQPIAAMEWLLDSP